MQRSQRNPPVAVVDQSPLRRAVITQPVVLDTPLLLPGTHKWRHSRFSRLGQALGLDQKQFPLPELQEGLAAFCIGTSAKHFFTAFCSAKHNTAEQLIPNE
jgi:hypothetical protein